MAITDAQKVDYLYKKIGFGVAKTDTSAYKSPSNEANASPLLTRGDTVWSQSGSIPATIPASNSSVVLIYADSVSSTVECTLDATVSGANRTWTTNLTNWIPPEFGSSYQVKVYSAVTGAGAPQTSGTQLFADGSGNNDSWFFDYQSGILNFADTNVPSSVSGKKIYISGARYVGSRGVTNFPNGLTIGNITISGNTITGNTGVSFGGNVTAGNLVTTGTVNGGNIIASGNVYGTYLFGSAAFLTGMPATYGNSDVAAYLLTNTGNVNAGNVNATNTYTTMHGDVYTNNIYGINGTLTLTPSGNIFLIQSTGAVTLPAGSTAQQPNDATAGSFRFNVDSNTPEYYTGSAWVPIGPSEITSQIINPDGLTDTFTLDQNAAATGIIVSINGTLQQPNTAYTVTGGNQIVFAEVPATTDTIEVRFIASSVVLEENSAVVTAGNVSFGTSATVVDSFNKTIYRSAKYTISATAANGDTQITDVYLVHNGSSSSITVGENAFAGGANVATYTTAVSGSSIQLKATAANAGAKLRLHKLYFTI